MYDNIYQINSDTINYSIDNNPNLQNNIENKDNIENRETIIQFNIEDINKDYMRRSNSRWSSQFGNTYRTEPFEKVKQLNISPIVTVFTNASASN